jgi:hypothetical protein
MRRRDLIIFFSIFFTLYGLLNFYIFSHGWSALAAHPEVQPWYIALFLFVALAWIAGRFLERKRITIFSSALIWLGSYWLAAMVYFLLVVALLDLIRFVDALVSFLPARVFDSDTLFTLLQASVIIVAIVVVAGALNARTPRITRLHFSINKKGNGLRSLRIAAASDIHLGTIICKKRLKSIVAKINALNADIVLLPGDVVDEDIGPVVKQNLGETLRRITAKYGVYAVTGNHEYIGGVEQACAYLTEHGITMLRDAATVVAKSVLLVGREDISYNRGNRRRKPLSELLNGCDRSLPIILMDHQPFRLHEAEEQGVDLQLSGHTHHGQLFPFNVITERVFEVSRGYKKKGNTHVYVSCGVGTWGPPVRIGNRPEILDITLTFA